MRPKRPSSTWTRHLATDTEQLDFEATLQNNRYVLTRLKTILEEELVALDTDSTADFTNPSWAYHQAQAIGQKIRLKKTLQLLDFIN